MIDLTLDKEIEMINESLIKLASEHFEKRYNQNMPKNSKELKRLRGLSYKLRHQMEKLEEIKRQNEESTYRNNIESYEIMQVNLHGFNVPGYTLEAEIEQVENRVNIAMNDHFEKLHLQRMNRERSILKELRKVINKPYHKIAYLKEIKIMRENDENTYQFTVINFH